jgi:hypothetical protein
MKGVVLEPQRHIAEGLPLRGLQVSANTAATSSAFPVGHIRLCLVPYHGPFHCAFLLRRAEKAARFNSKDVWESAKGCDGRKNLFGVPGRDHTLSLSTDRQTRLGPAAQMIHNPMC